MCPKVSERHFKKLLPHTSYSGGPPTGRDGVVVNALDFHTGSQGSNLKNGIRFHVDAGF